MQARFHPVEGLWISVPRNDDNLSVKTLEWYIEFYENAGMDTTPLRNLLAQIQSTPMFVLQ